MSSQRKVKFQGRLSRRRKGAKNKQVKKGYRAETQRKSKAHGQEGHQTHKEKSKKLSKGGEATLVGDSGGNQEFFAPLIEHPYNFLFLFMSMYSRSCDLDQHCWRATLRSTAPYKIKITRVGCR